MNDESAISSHILVTNLWQLHSKAHSVSSKSVDRWLQHRSNPYAKLFRNDLWRFSGPRSPSGRHKPTGDSINYVTNLWQSHSQGDSIPDESIDRWLQDTSNLYSKFTESPQHDWCSTNHDFGARSLVTGSCIFERNSTVQNSFSLFLTVLSDFCTLTGHVCAYLNRSGGWNNDYQEAFAPEWPFGQNLVSFCV